MNKNLATVFVVFLFSLSFVFADEMNISVQDQATNCLASSRLIVKELADANFSIARVNDTLKQAENMYLSQSIIEERGREGKFELVLPYCETLVQLREEAFNSRDAFQALLRFYNESFAKTEINTSSVDELLTQIQDEIASERYEKVTDLITRTYEEIITVKSEYTTLNLFYSSTSRSLKKFFTDNWKIIIISLTTLLILFFLYKSSIYRALIKKKIAALTTRKESLRRLIMKTQKDYFEGGNLSESTYTIRTKSFAEMIRDIDRQIPLLQERLSMYSGGRSKQEATYAKKDEKHKKKEKKVQDKHFKKHSRKLLKEVHKETRKSWKGFKKHHKKFKKVIKKNK